MFTSAFKVTHFKIFYNAKDNCCGNLFFFKKPKKKIGTDGTGNLTILSNQRFLKLWSR